MNNRTGILVLLSATLATFLAACSGGGGGDGDGIDTNPGGIDRGGITIAQGPISGFGSVIVGGVHYSTSGATITIDDQPGVESDLRVGQVVRLEGRLDASGTTGVATRITYNGDVEGPIQSIEESEWPAAWHRLQRSDGPSPR
jgi:hypothetical protein